MVLEDSVDSVEVVRKGSSVLFKKALMLLVGVPELDPSSLMGETRPFSFFEPEGP